ncbi:MAG: FtsX-like permease family protein [Marinoscillum sp.]
MKDPLPPKWIDRFLEWYCSEYYLEEVQGDLYEWFERRVKRDGLRKARFMYAIDVFRYFKLFRLKPFQKLINNSKYLSMKNIFKITYRNLIRDKISGFIRITNLVLGITIFMLSLVYARYELGYDGHHVKKDRLYRVGAGNPDSPWAATPLGVGPFALDQMPEVKRMTRMVPIRNTWARRGEDLFYEKSGFEADSSIFEMFSYEFIRGNPKTALVAPESMVITESFAKKYFGVENPMGQTIELLIDRGEKRVITGVIKDVPKQSHLPFDYLVSIYTLPDDYLRSWRNFFVYTYLEFEEGASLEQTKSVVKDEYVAQYNLDESETIATILTPVNKIHLYTNHEKEYADNGNVYYVYILFCIGLFVLIISCINFINLTVIKGLDRAKEVGLRKTVGASRSQLIMQFLGENTILLLFSGVLSLLILTVGSPFFKEFPGLELPLSVIENPSLLLILLAVLIVLQLLSGLYPSLVLSRFRPAEIIKSGSGSLSLKKVGFTRQALIVTQFSLSIILIIGSLIVYRQLNFMQTQDLGFQKDQVVLFKLNRQINEKYVTFRNRLLDVPGIKSVAGSSSVPGYRVMFEGVRVVGDDENTGSRLLLADQYFLETYDIEILDGKNFSDQVPEGRTEYMLNQLLVQEMFPDGQNPVGKQLIQSGDTGRVVAVIRDFNFKSLHEEVEPLLMKRYIENWGYGSVKFEAKSTSEMLTALEAVSQEIYPDLPTIEVEFLNDRFAQLYSAETKLQEIVWIFCVVTIILTISGIFSIATYNAQKRAKEIAIRKVLGGDLPELIKQLSMGFIYLLITALLIGLPGAYFLTAWWLQDFAYQIDISPLSFILSAVLLFVVIMVSSGFVTLRAASRNPADTLKYE